MRGKCVLPLPPAGKGEGSTATFTIPRSHPGLPGHFPGRPVVPGVVLLDEVLGHLPPGATLLTAKFTAPVEPGTPVMIHTTTASGRTSFICTVAGHTVLHGTSTS